MQYSRQLVEKYELDCSGLVVLTEAASGGYLFNPMIAILAGADEVITFCRDSRYGKSDDVFASMAEAYSQAKRGSSFSACTELSAEIIGRADIVTNSGHLRPLDSRFIGAMKRTGVISLMWEPWEIRPSEIDFAEAKNRNVLVMGTNEHSNPCNMSPYSPLTALHLLMRHEASIVDDRFLIIGGQSILAGAIHEGFRGLGLQSKLITTTAPRFELIEKLDWATYILVAEHIDSRLLIGPGEYIDTAMLKSGLRGVGVIAGQVDRVSIESLGISVFPDQIAPPGYLSYLASEIGPYPAMDLFAGGLKVGEVMAKARLQGYSTKETARMALEQSPAIDLGGELSWL